eukprot:SAG31_NODE_3076_length_4709_cov_2.785033_1_plen_313_part_10
MPLPSAAASAAATAAATASAAPATTNLCSSLQRNMKKFVEKSEVELAACFRELELHALATGKELTNELLGQVYNKLLAAVQADFHSSNAMFAEKASAFRAKGGEFDFRAARSCADDMRKVGVELGAFETLGSMNCASVQHSYADEVAAGCSVSSMHTDGHHEERGEETEFAELLNRVNKCRSARRCKGMPLPPVSTLEELDGSKMGVPELQEVVAAMHPANFTIERDTDGKIIGGSITVGLKKADLQQLLGECLSSARIVRGGTTLTDAFKSIMAESKSLVDALPQPLARDTAQVPRTDSGSACGCTRAMVRK